MLGFSFDPSDLTVGMPVSDVLKMHGKPSSKIAHLDSETLFYARGWPFTRSTIVLPAEARLPRGSTTHKNADPRADPFFSEGTEMFTIKPVCIAGHVIAEVGRYQAGGRCKECTRTAVRDYKTRNHDKIREDNRLDRELYRRLRR